MKRLKEKVKGLITVEIEGLNIEKLLNKFIRHRINIISSRRVSQNICEVTIFESDKNILNNLLKGNFESKVNASSIGNRFYNFILSRYIFFIGMIVAIISFTFFTSIVWNIDIEGNENISDNIVIEVLQDAGVLKGTKINDVDTNMLESLILEKIENVSLVSVAKVGLTIVVNIKEKVISGNEEVITSIVSDFDGIINSIDLIQGTALVKSGDIVKKGDILVDSYTLDGDNNIIPIKAKANIFATIWVKGEVVFDENDTKLVRSGDYYTKQTLSMFRLNMPLKRKNKQYTYYEIEKNSKNICKNTIIPFTIIEEKVYELIMVEEKKNFDKEKDVLVKQSIYLAYDNLNSTDNVNILSEQTDIIQVGSKYYITTYIKLTKQIGVDK